MAARGRHNARASSDANSRSSAQQRHNELMRVYRDSQPAQEIQNTGAVLEHDMVVLKRHFQFLRDEEADLERGERDWEVRMSVRYYRKLFREYALADLTRYKEGKVGLRWRTESEVVSGKGQFTCGNKACEERSGLHSYELLFAYVEHGEKKQCLVKVRVCEACARKLFYRKLKEKEKLEKEKRRRRDERKRDDEGRRNNSKKRRRDYSDEEDAHDDRRHGERKKPKDVSVHAQCVAINQAETQGLRRAANESDESIDTKEEDELARLLL